MANTFNSTVNESNGYSYVQYSGNVDLSGNLTDNHYTQAFKIGEFNQHDAGFVSIANGGTTSGDIISYLQVSNDPTNSNGWFNVAQLTDMDDDVTSNNQSATVGTSSGNDTTDFHAYEWARIKFDGQAGNDYTDVDWSLNCRKADAVGFAENTTLVSGTAKDSATVDV